ncbi:MAG TPA: hypothetical protein VEV39_09875 [Gemmatimonadales bacterium]|nr:hypothetical protein [Gemmatimonadales bacterium]
MRTMRLSFSVLAAAVLAVACGEGHAIFDVDVYSFIAGSGGDTLHYTTPGVVGTTPPLNNPPLKVTLLPGLGSSVVDTVQVTGAAAIQNNTGTGSLSFKIFFGADSNTVYSTTPILTTSGNAGPGADTTIMALNATLTSAQDSLFSQKQVFVGVQAVLSNNTTTPLDGRLKLTALHLRLVIKDKVF